ncbi:hypothetical protein C0W54_12930 [Photobacterium kishitanii]|uniref:SPOR domain-containing protein n=1 Tax=Photobacterium kishitanii TaxID=318456 RepID=UPI000D15FB1B|nr:SPOR domain-containing protein [Photobacterium kishitanii]PSW61175.1 hypothetical protein C0W54_12930 [Photobacterium kishitanii]
MKKIIALGLLSSVVGCAQLMPPKTPLQTPIETINTTKAAEPFVEPIVVAELDSSVKTDPLYQSIDSIAVSEQEIKEQPVTDTEEGTVAADNTAANEVTTNDVPAETSATEPSTNPVFDNAIATEISADPIADTVAAETAIAVAQTTVGDDAAVEPSSAAAAAASSDDIYKTVDMHGYSIQVTASRDEHSLATLLSSLESQQPAWINKKMLNGSQVYTLLLGHYANYDQAKAALASLPQAVQQNGAFVRNFYDIEHTRSPQLKQLQ